jgi:small subunit ribosomal protein S13
MNLNIKKKIGSNQRINFNFISGKKKGVVNNISKKLLNEVELKTKVAQNIEFLRKLKTFKGFRHRNNLPVRGQRTRTNAKTSRKKL